MNICRKLCCGSLLSVTPSLCLCTTFKMKWRRTNIKTKRINLHTDLTMIPLYVNSNIEDCSSNCKLLYSEISLLRHDQDFLFLDKGIIR
jgi:hypothetical protein